MIPDRGIRLLGTEVMLLAVSLVVAAGFGRLFDDSGGWFVPLAATAVIAHLAGAVLRRAGVGVALQLATVAVATGFIISWVHAPETLRFGFPTSETMSALALALDEAVQLYPEARAPTEPIDGFVIAAMAGMALVASMADVAAFRLAAPVQALVPPFALFAFCSVLGTGPDRAIAALAFAAAALGFVAVFRAVTEGSTTWLPGDHQRGPVALVRLGGGLTAVAIVAAAIGGPMLTGAEDEGLWTWRGGDGDGRRIVINPLVDIRSRMVEQSDEVAFVVESEAPSYWRLMSLDDFDGQQFTFSTTFRSVGSNLTGPSGTSTGEPVEQRFEIENLASPYLPAAFSPVRLHLSGEDARWDDRTQTLLLERDAGSYPGMEYRVESLIPDPTPEQLRAAPASVPDAIADRYLDLPPLDPRVVELTESVTAGAESPYDRALALQAFFRTEFDYSLTVPAGHSDSELVRFLFEDRAGYCEQFSAAFAAMARSSGLPSRVAVGFTVGEADPDDPQRYTVRGEHAHAWPEVWFEGIGWVPFEPTPGRGDPSAESHTGVPPDQEGGAEGTTTTTEATETPDLPAPDFDPDEMPDIFGDLDDGTSGGAGGGDDEGGVPGWLVTGGTIAAAAAAVVALWCGVVQLAVAGRRRWRTRGTSGPAAEIQAVWNDVLDAAASLDLRPRPTETQHEFGVRLAAAVPEVAEQSRAVAEAAAAARFVPDAADESTAQFAVEAGTSVSAALRDARSRRQRINDLVDIRRALPARRRPLRRQAGVAPA